MWPSEPQEERELVRCHSRQSQERNTGEGSGVWGRRAPCEHRLVATAESARPGAPVPGRGVAGPPRPLPGVLVRSQRSLRAPQSVFMEPRQSSAEESLGNLAQTEWHSQLPHSVGPTQNGGRREIAPRFLADV